MTLARSFIAAALTALCISTTAFAGDGMLGVYLTEDVGDAGGALIEEVSPESPAAQAGLRKGDRILSCDGKATPNSGALIPVLVNGSAGQTLTLRVSRDGWEKTFRITLARRQAAPAPAAPAVPKERGFLGVYLRQDDAGRPVIDGVMEGSPAAKAGMKVGDRVASVSGTKVSDPSGMIAAFGRFGVGDAVRVVVERDGKQVTLEPVLARRPAERTAPAPQAEPARPTPAPSPRAGKKPYIGIALVDNDGQGPLKVDDVQANSPAERFGLRPGDVIISANDKALKTIEDFVKLMQTMNAGDTVRFKIERDGWKSDVRLTLGARDG